MLLVAFSKYTGRAVFDDGSLELLPPGGGELGRREKEAMEEGEDRGRERREEGVRRISSSGRQADLIALEFLLTKAT